MERQVINLWRLNCRSMFSKLNIDFGRCIITRVIENNHALFVLKYELVGQIISCFSLDIMTRRRRN